MANEAVVVGLLEDDRDQAELYRAWLEQAGFMVRAYVEVKDFRRRLGALLGGRFLSVFKALIEDPLTMIV